MTAPATAPVRTGEPPETSEPRALANLAPMTFEQVVHMGDALVRTGFLPEHIKNGAQAAAIILTGQEMGMPPMRALRSLAMVKGKVTEYADSQLARFKADGGRAKWLRLDEEAAELWLRHPNGDEHTETFTIEDAERAGLTKPGRNNEPSMYHKHPKAMLRSRTITAGLKSIGWEGGVGAYDPEEAIAFSAPTTPFGVETESPLDVANHAAADQSIDQRAPLDEPEPNCPKCGGRMWDNRLSKRTAKAPDYKCRQSSCDGVFWPGQWPPASLATAEQHTTIAELLAAADLADAEKAKYAKRAASTSKPLTAERADEMIGYLRGLVPPAGLLDESTPDPAAAAPTDTKLAPGKVEDALDGPHSAKVLGEQIAALLKNEKLDENDRTLFRSKLERAITFEQMQALVKEITDRLELPF